MKQVMVFPPSDTCQYDYAGHAHSGITSRYCKDDSQTCSLSQALPVQDVTPPAPNPALEPGESPPRKCRIKEEVRAWPKETYGTVYHPDPKDDPDEGASSTALLDVATLFINFEGPPSFYCSSFLSCI